MEPAWTAVDEPAFKEAVCNMPGDTQQAGDTKECSESASALSDRSTNAILPKFGGMPH